MTGRVALVTGANSGIGLAIAERLVGDGYALGYATRKQDEKDKSAYDRLAERGSVEWVVGDLADREAPRRLVEETVAAFGRLDVLVNNAGLTLRKPALELTAEDFDSVFSVDVRGAFLASQAAARAMVEGGVIVNITSVHEHVPRPGFALYAPAKAALGMLTRSLALELAPKIRVVAVAPGVIATERNKEDAERLSPEVPLGRAGTPEEVAAAVAFLVSEEARYVTGVSYLVDGGIVQQVFED
ncbi:MAG TPA: glucose 1-dehydrogenase [Gaiellaceae bacterium]|nr:glucose 1-dehydrogenase [Gaiellaceae bacterium]